MTRYRVGWTYTVWVEVDADDRQRAFDSALACEYNFEDTNKSGAVMELNEHDDPRVELAEEDDA